MQFIDYILRQVDNLKKFIPLLLLLKGRGMLQSHMNKINKQFGCNIVLTETTIRLLSKMDFHEGEKLEFIRSVAELAQKEWSIKQTLDQTVNDLDACVIKIMHFQGSYLFSEVEADLIVMKECLLKANSIVHSSYAKRY